MQCNKCGGNIIESIETLTAEFITCPSCGKRTFQLHVNAEAKGLPTLYKFVDWFRGGRTRNKARFHRREGDSYTVSTGKWNYLIRIVDRVHDWYYELIVDPRTGEKLHTKELRLSEHKGYGSAKQNTNLSDTNQA